MQGSAYRYWQLLIAAFRFVLEITVCWIDRVVGLQILNVSDRGSLKPCDGRAQQVLYGQQYT
jgi:hypothetical protein